MAFPLQFCCDPAGLVVAVFDDGSVRRQVRVPGVGNRPAEWKPVDLHGVDGTPCQVACGEGYRLVLLTRTGQLFGQRLTGGAGFVEIPLGVTDDDPD